MKIVSSFALGSGTSYSAFTLLIASPAISGDLWRMAKKSFSLTTSIPSIFSRADASRLINLAPCAGGLKIFAYNMPGRRISPAYFASPVTFANASAFNSGFPIILNSDGVFTGGFSLNGFTIFLPLVS
ncbi:hypothetical protein ES708_35287 [subsurface metagenome]